MRTSWAPRQFLQPQGSGNHTSWVVAPCRTTAAVAGHYGVLMQHLGQLQMHLTTPQEALTRVKSMRGDKCGVEVHGFHIRIEPN